MTRTKGKPLRNSGTYSPLVRIRLSRPKHGKMGRIFPRNCKKGRKGTLMPILCCKLTVLIGCFKDFRTASLNRMSRENWYCFRSASKWLQVILCFGDTRKIYGECRCGLHSGHYMAINLLGARSLFFAHKQKDQIMNAAC